VRHFTTLVFAIVFFSVLGNTNSSAQAIKLSVDLTDAPRNIFHEHLTIPTKPGPQTFVYPKWIPGNHRPSGPITNLLGIKFSANGTGLPWERDAVDMYAFHVNVPAGVQQIEAEMDTTTFSDSAGSSGAATSANVLDLNWNQVVLYPQNSNSNDVQFAASVHLPAGWKFGTALPVSQASGDNVDFSPVSLTTLIDSPLIAGSHYRKIELTDGHNGPSHVIDMVSESEYGLAMSDADVSAYRALVRETGALFGARHYTQYHFLYTLSDEVASHGLEHHQSSDNAVGERTLTDPGLHLLDADLLPHEFVHSWNGKYRRPAGLATRNYQEPMVGDLLWVYEGLTDYLGGVLAARSGLRSQEEFRDDLASTAAMLDHRTGRTWRSLEDTARSVQILRLAGATYQNWRRGLDYYTEGIFIWLEVDSKIRQLTHGQKSLDDFCHQFHGGQSGPPTVVPYEFNDVVKALNDVVPYDWASLLKQRTTEHATHAPLAGVTGSGWKLVYTDKPNLIIQAGEKQRKSLNAYYSLGFGVNESGTLEDVIPGSPADTAGIAPGMKLVAVKGRRYSKDVLRQALRETKTSNTPLELLLENREFFKTYSVNYHEGEQYPHLERADGEDLLSEIAAPRTK
jgi:predicted metalloprotease with PDZ domain